MSDRTCSRHRTVFDVDGSQVFCTVSTICHHVRDIDNLIRSPNSYLTQIYIDDTIDYDSLTAIKQFDGVWEWLEARADMTELFPSYVHANSTISGLILLGARSSISTTRSKIIEGRPVFERLPNRYDHKNENKTAFKETAYADITGSITSCGGGIWDEISNNPWKYEVGEAHGVREDTDDFGTYNGGGYLALLSSDDSVTNLKRLKCLHDSRWIDRYSRVLYVEFPLFNMNTNIVTALRIRATFGISG